MHRHNAACLIIAEFSVGLRYVFDYLGTSAGITSLGAGVAHTYNLPRTEHARYLKISQYCRVHSSVTVSPCCWKRAEQKHQPKW